MSKLKYNLSAAIVANQYVKTKMIIGASNKLRPDFLPAWQCSGSLVNTGYMREQIDRDVKTAFNTATYTTNIDGMYKAQRIILEKTASAAEAHGCGNCGEQSAIAFVFLRKQKTFPLDWMEVDGYAHAFVIIGRKRGSAPATYLTWGDEAVVCDPGRDITAAVRSEAAYFSTRKPNWIYGEIG